jgi:hypothetical protein
MLRQRRERAAGGRAASRKLYSVGGVLRGRQIEGTFEAGGREYEFSYAPVSAALAGGKLELTGTLGVGPAGGRAQKRSQAGVRATLASTQGGIGDLPRVRAELLGVTGQVSDTEAADQADKKLGEEKEPGGEGPGGEPPAPAGGLPVTEATDALAFVGVLYLRLSPVDGRAVGVPVDMSAVQLNARLAPRSDLERDLQWLFSGAVQAVYGQRKSDRAATAYLGEINKRLKA